MQEKNLNSCPCIREYNEPYKKKSNFWRIIVLLIITYLLLSSNIINKITENHRKSADHIAKLEINGFISYDPHMIGVLRSIKDDLHVKAVIIELDSPGGRPVGAEAMFDEICAISQVKPVVTIIQNEATSAAYWIAAAGDRIFAHNTSITGSIGVVLEGFNFYNLLEKLGVESFNISSGKNKGISSFKKNSEENKESLQKVVDDMYEVFVEAVKRKRNFNATNTAKLKEIFDGRIFTGRQALGLQLIDELGGQAEALIWLQKKHNLDSNKMPILNYHWKE